jgi:hypothetical protein
MEELMTHEMLLEFHGITPELRKTLFREVGGTVKTAVRGKTSGALEGAGTFQWTTAVKALSLLVVKAVLTERHTPSPTDAAALLGGAGSLAATLDYAVTKEPAWTVDMFGVDTEGRSLIRRLMKRTNTERKYPGPVTVSLNTRAISPTSISIWWDGKRVEDEIALRTLERELLQQTGSAHSSESPEDFFQKSAAA